MSSEGMKFGTRAEIEQNLKDAGCSGRTIQEFFSYSGNDEEDKRVTLLERHREALLDEVHNEEKKISCLDYLIYRMRMAEK